MRIGAIVLGLFAAAAVAQPMPALKLVWLGWDEDRVGKDRGAAPDGLPDHHFTLEARSIAASQIVAVTLRSGGQRWSSQGTADNLLAIEANGAKLDLYAHDIGQWDTGREVLAEVALGDGRKLERSFTLAAPPDRLLGLWQMFCPSRDPNAFEPMTISGRLQLHAREDGTVGGVFGALSITGKLEKDGAVSGIARNETETVEWRGTLAQVKRGKPLRGGGTFRLLKTAQACTGEGTWFAR